MSITAGTGVNVTMVFDDEILKWVFFKSETEPTQATIVHTFTAGTRRLNFIATNAVSSETVNVNLVTQQQIADFGMTYHCQPDRTVLFDWTVTAGSHMTAIVRYGDSTVSVYFLQTLLLSQEISYKFNASGDYYVTIHYHNSYSEGMADLNITVETGIVLGDYNVTTLIAVANVVDIVVPVEAGNTISLFVDFEDDIQSYTHMFSNDWDVIAAVNEITFSVYYTKPGNYSLSCRYINSASSVIHNYTMQVYHAITNLQVVSNSVRRNTGFDVIVSAHASCIPDCNLDIVIGACFQTNIPVQSDKNDIINKTTTVAGGCDLGVYDMSVKLRNIISMTSVTRKQYMEVPIVNITATMEFTTYNELVFNITLIMEEAHFNPAGLTYTCVHHFYGNNQKMVTHLLMTVMPNIIVQHNYTSPGLYEYNVTCYNRISVVETSLEVNVINPDVVIEGLTVGYPHEPVAVGDVITFPLFIDRGNNVTFDFDFGDNTTAAITVVTPIETPINTNMSTNLSHAFEQSLSTGPYLVQVNASNAVSYQLAAVYVDIHELVTDVAVTVHKNHVKVGESLAFSVSVTTGTHAICYAFLGDGGPHTVEYFRRQSSVNPVEFNHIYTQPGVFRPQFVVNNTLSSANYAYPKDIVIQHPITGITLTAKSPVTVPTGIVIYEVRVDSTDPWPTDPFCNWAFVEGVIKVAVATPLAAGDVYNETFMYSETHTGTQTVNVTCSNLVSKHTMVADVMVQRQVEDVIVHILTPAVAVGEVAYFDIIVMKGSHLKYAVDFNDGSLENYAHPDLLNSTAVFNFMHNYVAEGNYTITLNVSNEVSFEVVVATQPVVVQLPLEGLSVSSNSPVGTPSGVIKYTVTADKDIHAKNLFLSWTFGDGAATKWQYADSLTEDAPLTQTHTYNGARFIKFTTFVNCSNHISYLLLDTTVIVEVIIEQISLTTSTNATVIGGVVTFTANAQQGSNITYTLQYGDKSMRDAAWQYNAHSAVDISHNYTTPGNYTVQLTASNDISNRKTGLTNQMIVQHPLVMDNLKLSYAEVISTELPNTYFTITVTNGMPEPTTVHVLVNISGQVSSHFVGHWPFTWKQLVDDAIRGNVDVNITLTNLVSSCNLPAVLIILEPITDLELTVPIVIKTEQQVTVTAEMVTGSEMDGTVEFGDGSLEKVAWLGTEHSYSVTHVYTKAGTYTVTVSVKNQFTTSPVIASSSIEVQNPIKQMTVVSRQHFVLPPGELDFMITPDKDVLTPSGPFDIVVTFGDGQTTRFERDTVNDLDFTHKYSTFSDYDLKINISNRVSSQVIDQQIEVLDPIAGLTLSASIDNKTLTVKNGNLTVKQNKVIAFKAECEKGSKVTYKWTFGSDSPLHHVDGKMTHVFHQLGSSLLVLTASNDLEHDMSVQRNMFVIPVLEVDTVTDSLSVTVNGELNFHVKLVSPVERLCVQFSIANNTGETIYWQGTSVDICNQVLPSSVSFDNTTAGFTTLQPDGVLLNLRRMMDKLGNYTVSVNIYTDGIMVEETRALAVNQPVREKLIIMVKHKEGSTPDMPIIIEKSSPFSISPAHFTVTVNAAYKEVNTIWEIFLYKETNGTVIRTKVPLESIGATVFAGELLIPPGQLPYGKYLCKITITMPSVASVLETGEVFVESTKTPLKVMIRFNAYRVIGEKQTVVMNAIDESGDADIIDDKTEMTFEWFCRRLDEPSIEDDTNNTVRLPTKGESTSNSRYGCFGDGPGRLDIDKVAAGKFHFEAAFMQSGTKYVMTVRAWKDNRVGTASQILEVIQGQPLKILIKCVSNCQSAVNPQLDYEVTALCTDCPAQMKPIYNWIVTSNNTEVLSYTVSESPRIVIRAGLLDAGFNYSLSVNMSVDGQFGLNQINFFVTNAPFGGNCSIQPTNGHAFDIFKVDCKGWQDGTGLAFQKLSYSYRYVIGESIIPVFTKTPMLPSGAKNSDYTYPFHVQIKNKFGAMTVIEFNVTVHEIGEATSISFVDTLSSINPTQAILSLEDTLAIFQSVTHIVEQELLAPDPLSQPGKEEPSSKEKEEIAAAKVERASTKFVSMLSTLNVIGQKLSSTSVSIIEILNSVNTIMQKIPPTVSAEVKEEALSLLTHMSQKLGESAEASTNEQGSSQGGISTQVMTQDRKKEVSSLVMKGIKRTMEIIDLKPPVVEKKVEVILDEVPDEEAEERAIIEKERKKKETISLKKATAVATETIIANIREAMRVNLKTEADLESKSNVDPEEDVGSDDVMKFEVFRFGNSSQPVSLTLQSVTAGSDVVVDTDKGSVELPGGMFSTFTTLEVVLLTENIYSWVDGARDVNSDIIKVNLYDISGGAMIIDSTVATSSNFEVNFKMPQLTPPPPDKDVSLYDNMIYKSLNISTASSALMLQIQPTSGQTWQIFIKFNVTRPIEERPTNMSYDFSMTLPSKSHDPWLVFVSESVTKQGIAYLGMRSIEKKQETSGRKRRAAQETSGDLNLNFTVSLHRCRAWDSSKELWRSDICQLLNSSTQEKVNCKCGDLSRDVSSYATGFSMPKVNTIDFKKIFDNLKDNLLKNPTVYSTVLCIIAVYLLLIVWARRMDRRDLDRWGMTPLLDNSIFHSYRYRVSVFTGLRRNAGTTSNVCFILAGSQGDTGMRLLDDGKKKQFTRGSVRHFLMTLPQPLGILSFLRIWHDNSGDGVHAGWFLDKIVVEDLVTSERYFFLCGRWLATDEDDGQVNCNIAAAVNQGDIDFHNAFFTNARAKLSDDHIWFSVVMRPTPSTFTRVQRLTCCVSLLFTTMVTNAMWYQSDDVEHDQAVRLGPIIFSAAALLVSIFSSLFVIPVNLLIVQLFRKSKPADWEGDKEAEGEEKEEDTGSEGEKEEQGSERESSDEESDASSSESTFGEEEKKPGRVKKEKEPWWRQQYPLPHWCVYVAWGIAVTSIIGSAFFVIMYSFQFGKEKSEAWLSALVFSFTESVILIQPFKVVATAIVIASIFKTLDDSSSKTAAGRRVNDDHDPRNADHLNTMEVPLPPSNKKLAQARRQRIYEKRMWGAIKEIATYMFFLLTVSFITWGTKDDTVYLMNTAIRELYNGGNGTYRSSWVSRGSQFWRWCQESVVPNTYNEWNYADDPTTRRVRAFLMDMASFRVGAVRMRQVRVSPASCSIVPVMRKAILECNNAYNVFTEEDRNFTVGWALSDNSTDLSRIEKAYRYHSMLDLKGMPTYGLLEIYGGGGYIADLGTSQRQAKALMKELIANEWIDIYTRAVFIEFTVFNPNINLFAFVNLLMEFPETGSIVPYPRVESFHVYSTLGGMGTAILLGQLIFVIMLIIHTASELIKLNNQRKEYFSDPWNYVEVAVIITSVIAVAMHIMRELFSQIVMKQLSKEKEAYTNYSGVALYDGKLTELIGAVIFLISVKMLRLLRFNKHIHQFAVTLRLARHSLGGFLLMAMIIFINFTVTALLIFGTTLKTFSKFIMSFQTLFSMLIGKFDLREMTGQMDSWLGKMFFVVFSLVVFFILVNMFLGILMSAYTLAQQEPLPEDRRYDIFKFLHSRVKQTFCRKKQDAQEQEMGEMEIESTNFDLLEERLHMIDIIVSKYKSR